MRDQIKQRVIDCGFGVSVEINKPGADEFSPRTATIRNSFGDKEC